MQPPRPAFRFGVRFGGRSRSRCRTLIFPKHWFAVSADHSHVFTIAGYPTGGNPILGLATGYDSRGEPSGLPILAADGKPYATLGYQNGPGAVLASPPAPIGDSGERQQALVSTADAFNNSAPLAGAECVQASSNRTGYSILYLAL